MNDTRSSLTEMERLQGGFHSAQLHLREGSKTTSAAPVIPLREQFVGIRIRHPCH